MSLPIPLEVNPRMGSPGIPSSYPPRKQSGPGSSFTLTLVRLVPRNFWGGSPPITLWSLVLNSGHVTAKKE